MELKLLHEDETIKISYGWIVRQHDEGLCPVSRPVWPGCRDALSLRLYQHRYDITNGWEYRSLDKSLEGAVFYEKDSPLSRYLYVTTFVTRDLPLPPRPVLGCAVVFGDRIALYPSEEPESESEPTWVRIPVRSGRPDTFLRSLISENAGIGVVPYKLFIAEDPNYPYKMADERLVDTRVPVAQNKECQAALVGYALTVDCEAVYLHLAGPQANVKSIVATVIQGKPLTLITPVYTNVTGIREREYRVFLQPIPQTRQYRAILVAKAAMPGETCEERAFFISCVPNDFTGLARRLNALLPIPIKEEWGKALYNEADTLVRDLLIGGDVRMGVSISTDVDGWVGLASRLLQEGALEI